jgi:hypothetical protein
VKTAPEINQEIRRIRERAKSLSGFWISEFAAAIATLEWALGKRDKPPSEDIGSPASEHGKIAERLLDALGKEQRPSKEPKKSKEQKKQRNPGSGSASAQSRSAVKRRNRS